MCAQEAISLEMQPGKRYDSKSSAQAFDPTVQGSGQEEQGTSKLKFFKVHAIPSFLFDPLIFDLYKL